MNAEIFDAVNAIAREKNIGKDKISEIIKEIFMTLIKNRYKFPDTFDVIVNPDKGEVEIFQEMEVVEEVMDPEWEIGLETAQKDDPDYEEGDTYVKFVDPSSFGRREIIKAKQALKQKIRDLEKDLIAEEYQRRVGEIIVGDVSQVKHSKVILNYDKIEAILPESEQIQNERIKRGQALRCVILRVDETPRGPEIIVSRTDNSFLIRLFELEVPEILDGIIEIRGVAREPGIRAKIAVESTDRRIDPVGACVGQRGVRIQSIVRELNGEKIDIVPWDVDISKFISNSMGAAKPIGVKVNTQTREAVVIVEDDNVAIAIGKNRQNVDLASKLTGCNISIQSTSERKKSLKFEFPGDREILESFDEVVDDDFDESTQEGQEEEFYEDVYLKDIEGLDADSVQRLLEHKIETIDDVWNYTREKFIDLGFLSEEDAAKLYDTIDELYGDFDEEEF